MANELPEESNPSQFDETIEAILTTEAVQGDPPGFNGQPTGKININLLKLANRFRWLKNALEALNINVPNATTTERGIAELATKQEAEALQDTTRITPPKRVGDILKHSNAQATESQRGTAELANKSEAEDGTDNTKIMTSEKSMQQLRHSNAGANTTRRGTVQRATEREVDQETNTTKYVTPALLAGVKSFLRTQTPPSASNAKGNVGYIKTDANDKALNIKIKTNRKKPFFSVTVANLGDGHLGYAGSGYDSLGDNYAVNSGGSTGFSGLGVISEQFKDLVSTSFTRVGTSDPTANASGLGAHNEKLYLLKNIPASNALNATMTISEIDPETGDITQIRSATDFGSPSGAAVLDGVLYYAASPVGVSGKRIRAYDIDAGTFSLGTVNVSTPSGMAPVNGKLYAVYQSGQRVGEINITTGEIISSTVQTITGYESDDIASNAVGLASVNGVLHLSTSGNGAHRKPYLYVLNPANGGLTLVGETTPENGALYHLTQLGDYLYGIAQIGTRGVYRSIIQMGNRRVVIFPNSTTEVDDNDATLRLYPESGGNEVIVTRDTDLTDAIVFASDFDDATAHTIASGDSESMALYKSDGTQLYEGSNEAVFATIPLETPIGV